MATIDKEDPRYLALMLANAYQGETVDQTIARAKRYYRFITADDPAPADPAPVVP